MSKATGVCCVCIKNFPFLEGIYDRDERNVTYYQKLKKCIPNELWYKDYKICKNCIDKLEAAYDFVCMCIRNEENRKDKYGKNIGPYICNECNKSFKWEITLKRHIGKIHKLQDSSVIDDENYTENKENNKIEPICAEDYKESDTEPNLVTVEYFANLEHKVSSDNNCDSKHAEQVVKHENNVEGTDGDNDYDIKDEVKDEVSSSDSEDNIPIAKLNTRRKYTKRRKVSSDNSASDIEKSIKVSNKLTKKSKRGPYKCKYCDEIFRLTVMLKKHVLSVHSNVRPFACDQCEATYKTSFALLIHKRVHTGERPYICTVCGKGFRASPDLIVHTKTHNPIRGYKCPNCEKSFKTASNLRRHRICVHTKPEDYEFQCSQCGRKFPFKDLLNHHMARHAGTRNFACHICENKFTVKNDLHRHLRLVHWNEQRSSCKECSREFKTIFGLKKHMKTAHGLGAYKEAEKTLMCPYCPKMFPYNNKLQRHILTHTGERPFKCEICTKGFRDRFDLKTHLSNTHQIIV